MKDAKPKTTYHWMVGHPDYSPVPVNADSWEEATQAAAALWCVPWSKVAAMCEAISKRQITLGRCCRCGRTTHDNTDRDGYCDLCRKTVTMEKAELRRWTRKHWDQLPKRPAARRDFRK